MYAKSDDVVWFIFPGTYIISRGTERKITTLATIRLLKLKKRFDYYRIFVSTWKNTWWKPAVRYKFKNRINLVAYRICFSGIAQGTRWSCNWPTALCRYLPNFTLILLRRYLVPSRPTYPSFKVPLEYISEVCDIYQDCEFWCVNILRPNLTTSSYKTYLRNRLEHRSCSYNTSIVFINSNSPTI